MQDLSDHKEYKQEETGKDSAEGQMQNQAVQDAYRGSVWLVANQGDGGREGRDKASINQSKQEAKETDRDCIKNGTRANLGTHHCQQKFRMTRSNPN